MCWALPWLMISIVLNQPGAFMFPLNRPCPSTPQSLTPKLMQLRFGANSPRPSPFYSPASNPVQPIRCVITLRISQECYVCVFIKWRKKEKPILNETTKTMIIFSCSFAVYTVFCWIYKDFLWTTGTLVQLLSFTPNTNDYLVKNNTYSRGWYCSI